MYSLHKLMCTYTYTMQVVLFYLLVNMYTMYSVSVHICSYMYRYSKLGVQEHPPEVISGDF